MQAAGSKAVKFDVIVLAAGRGSDDPMAGAFATEHKCLIPVGGVPMLARVLRALMDCQNVADILVSVEQPSVVEIALDEGDIDDEDRISFIPSEDKASTSVAHAAEALGMSRPILVTTADHALLTPEMVSYFCETSLATRADVTVGLESADLLLGTYPDAKRTFFRFADGGYSGCNLFSLLTPEAIQAVRFWRQIERERKKPWRLISAFGWRELVVYLTGRMSLDQAMLRASDMLGVRARAVSMPFADAAIDVDKPADLTAVEKILASRAA